jgi:hypothetical protein
MHKLWRLAAVLALVTVGCRAETNVVLDIADDGSGTYTVELGLDEELQELLSGFTGGEGDGLIPGFDLDVPGLEGNPLDTLESRVEGDMTFYTSTDTFATLAELTTLVQNATGEGNSFDAFDVTIGDEKAEIVASAGAPGDLTGDLDLPISLDIIEQAFSANVIVALPGSVEEHNADEVLSDGRLKWNISLSEGVDIRAVSDFGESSFPWTIVVVAALVVAAFGIAVAVARRRAQRPAAAVAAAGAPPEPLDFCGSLDDDGPGEPASPFSR